MADTKITQLATLGALANADLFVAIDDVAGTPTSTSVRADEVKNYIESSGQVPPFIATTTAETAAGVTIDDPNRDVGDIRRYGAAMDGVTDDSSAFDDAFAVAKSARDSNTTQSDGAAGYLYGGLEVYIPPGRTLVSAMIEIPYNCTLRGAGKRVSTIISGFDGTVIRSEYAAGTDPYSNRSGIMQDFSIEGDDTLTSQVGMDLLRWGHGSLLSNIQVSGCGSHGIRIRESVGGILKGVRTTANAGDGIVLQQGIDNWTDAIANGNPCNAMTLIDCVSYNNDGPGLRINDSNGNFVIGGFYQGNYSASGDNVGYNIEIEGTSRGNSISTWCEGAVKAHIYSNTDSATANDKGNFIRDCTLIADASGGTNDRAVICNKGLLIIENIVSNSGFRTINSSNAPIQCNKANTGRVIYRGQLHAGTSVNGLMVEDENNLDYNLDGYAHQTFVGGSISSEYGRKRFYTESNRPTDFYQDTGSGYEALPWCRIDPAIRGISFSDGTGGVDASLGRAAANVVGCVTAGDGLSVGNNVANTNTPSGATNNAIPIYDETGSLLGYIPVYAATW